MGSPYSNAHARAKTAFGSAAYNECDFCGLTAEQYALDWAAPDIRYDNKGRAYSDDPSWYMPACRRCHRAYDRERAGLDAVGLIRLRERLWKSTTDEAREVQRKSRESAQRASLRYKFKVADVVMTRVRVMGDAAYEGGE
jgi:hypothetical protein